MTFTASDIKTLREKTGAGMMDCKKALTESGGEIESAIEWLRKNGINTAQKKSSRTASDGLVNVLISGNKGVMIEINSETDFVARNENFQTFCDDLSEICLKNNISSLEELLKSNYLKGNSNVQEELTNLIAKIGENIIIKRLRFISNQGNYLQKYLHNSISSSSGKIGVVLAFNCKSMNDEVKEFSKQICMHIAALDPKSLDIDSLDEGLIKKERSIYMEQLKSSGKPDEILEKIINGKINKFYEDVCLLEQIFVVDTKNKIKKCIEDFNTKNNLDFKIENYFIYKLGQEE